MRLARSLFLLILFSGCGYRAYDQEETLLARGSTITIPYVENDIDGQLTDELVKTFSSAGFRYRPYHGSLELKVKIVDQKNECLGWRYNHTKEGKRNDDLICTEGRRHVGAEVTLIDALNDEVIFGPVLVQDDFDFDYYSTDDIKDLSFKNSAGKRISIVRFSLGQLDSVEGAYDDAWTPLSRRLSKKILDLILHASYY